MTSKIAILYPSAVMALLTLTLLLSMGIRRFIAVQTGAVGIKYYRTYNEGGEPDGMRRHTRHVQNHFEVPPLFHLALFGTYLVGQVDGVTLALAWFFVGSRIVHSCIHLTYNNVSHRFFVFALGVMAVTLIWIRLMLTMST